MMHHVLNDSTTYFIYRLALKAKHWLPRTGHTVLRLKIANVQFSTLFIAILNIGYPTHLGLISNICLIIGNFKDSFCYIVYILPDIRQLYGVSSSDTRFPGFENCCSHRAQLSSC